MSKVCAYESFDQLPPSYATFFDEAGASSIFFSLDWFRHLSHSVFPQNAPTLLYGVESPDGNPELALPFWKVNEGLHPAGANVLASAANYYTPLFSPVVCRAQGGMDEKFSLLAQAIVHAEPGWDIVHLHPLDPHASEFALLADALRRAGLIVDSYFCFGNWYLDVGGRSYNTYFDSLPSPLRNTLRRKLKQMDKEGRLKIEIVTAGSRLADGISAYESVYNASWKIPEPHPEFMPGLIRLCAERGWLRLGLAYVDGSPAAAQVWLVKNGVASIFKLAYDQRFANLSIGSILTARLMEHVIDVDRVREVDFLTGDDAYKRDWMSARRERHAIIAFNPRTFPGAIGALRHVGGRKARNIYRSVVQRIRPARTP